MIDKVFLKQVVLLSLFFIMASFRSEHSNREITNQMKIQENEKEKKHIVFLVTEDSLNYQAHKTIPEFARLLEEQAGYKTTVLLGTGTHGAYRYPDFKVVEQADLLVIFARRIALPHQQMNSIKKYISSGKPIVGIRTANHAFTVREKIEDGFEGWPEFVAEVLGCENRGYGPVEPGTDVSVNIKTTQHPIVKNLPLQWHSQGNVYLVAPLLDSNSTVLLNGRVNDMTEPVAWTRQAGQSKIFYTSLGHPTDFKTTPFINLLIEGIKWALQ